MRRLVASLIFGCLITGNAHAQPVHYDEAVDGDMEVTPGVGYSLTVTLGSGTNTVTGVLGFDGTTADIDPFNLIVPEGQQIESIHFEYITTILANPGNAAYTFYLDGTGIVLDDGLPPRERVLATQVPSDSREFYADFMPLGAGQYGLGRPGSSRTSTMVFEIAYTWTIEVSGGDPEPPQITEISVPYQAVGPILDGVISLNEWRVTPQIQLENGNVTVVHDDTRLYFLFNMRADRTDNAFRDGGPDQVWLLADVDEDLAVTPNVDRRYRMLAGTGNFRYETYAPPGGFPLTPPVERSFSALAEGFGCFFADRSLALGPSLSCDSHRVWEVAIDLLEVQASADKSVRLGLLAQTELDEIDTLPADLTDFSTFVQFQMSGDTAATRHIPTTPTDPLEVLDLRITQGIQNPAHDLDLVAGRTAYVDVLAEQYTGRLEPPIVTVFASRDGVDLPGSPYTRYVRMGYWSTLDPPRSRGTWYLPLPGDELHGDVTFNITARQAQLLASTGGPDRTVSFVDTVTPTYWVVPIDSGTTTPQLPGNAFLDRQEAETHALLPVANIDFVRRPALAANPPTKDDADALVNEYLQQVVLAWTMGLLFTGEAPFALPDQTIGAFASSKNFGTTIGRAYARWVDGTGKSLWIKDNQIENGPVLAHEINHNLDLDTSGTWGRHIMGCTAVGFDPQWPYTDSTIQERSLLTKPVFDKNGFALLPPLSIEPGTPDYMSYCRANFAWDTPAQRAYPYQWVSPYRWQRQLDNTFRVSAPSLRVASAAVSAAMPAVQDSLYIRGGINANGSGELEPVLRQPGFLRADQRPGDYAIRLADCADRTLLSQSFGASFVDVEGEPRDTSHFEMTLPDLAGLCNLQLRKGDAVLAERVVSASAPEVRLIQPNGGEIWDGIVTVNWDASDADGDEVTAALLYSPDDGATWLPVASGLTGTEIQIDTAGLPGSDQARLRSVVTDGLNTAQDDSDDVFTVTAKPPHVQIVGPDGGAPLFAGQRQRFDGMARDTFGNTLSVDSFVWTLDGVAVGIGNPLELVLQSGTQALTLTVSPASGPPASTTLALNVLGYDGDNDQVPDEEDMCPESDVGSEVIIDDCSTGVTSRITNNGCTVSEILEAAFVPGEPGSKTIRSAARTLRNDGIVDQREWLEIQLCLRPPQARGHGR